MPYLLTLFARHHSHLLFSIDFSAWYSMCFKNLFRQKAKILVSRWAMIWNVCSQNDYSNYRVIYVQVNHIGIQKSALFGNISPLSSYQWCLLRRIILIMDPHENALCHSFNITRDETKIRFFQRDSNIFIRDCTLPRWNQPPNQHKDIKT